ncbi:MAG: phosphate acyltransferase PlsX [Burkholderiaceae bacterium]
MTITIAVDCMGGDHGPTVTVPAAIAFLKRTGDARLLLVGREPEIEKSLTQTKIDASLRARIEIEHTDEVVEMDDPPAVALRSKKRSSMRLALQAVRDEKAQACVSAGNTGALMAISRFVLKMLSGIERPAIATQLPHRHNGTTTMLDLGANVDCEPSHLLQFGLMGSALVTALDDKPQPSVGLLNIGEEVIKGNDTVKQAGSLLASSGLNFYGNVEGNDIYTGVVDVIVCDGFVGNVALKTSEGLAQMLASFIREEFTRHPLTRLMALFSFPVLRRFKRRVDHRRYNGAALVGLRGVVFKSHGSADPLAFESAIERAHHAAGNRLVERISETLEAVQKAEAAAQPNQAALTAVTP